MSINLDALACFYVWKPIDDLRALGAIFCKLLDIL